MKEKEIWHEMESLEVDFTHLEMVGSGKFGKVYRVVCSRTGVSFAAKHIKCRRASERRRVWDEIEILQGLSHPNLINLHAVYEDQDKIVQILEYLPGGELFERIIECTCMVLTERDIAGFVRQILTALEYLHSRNVVHLDLKPENIVCTSPDKFDLKLVDFGLARRLDDTKSTCVMQGTPDFVSPEVVNFEPISTASDMWSVGVITYVLLSGLSPFLGDSNLQTYTNITGLNFTFEEDEFEPISDSAKDFIRALLVLKPQCRMRVQEALAHPWLTCNLGTDSRSTLPLLPILRYSRTTTFISLKTIVVHTDDDIDGMDDDIDGTVDDESMNPTDTNANTICDDVDPLIVNKPEYFHWRYGSSHLVQKPLSLLLSFAGYLQGFVYETDGPSRDNSTRKVTFV